MGVEGCLPEGSSPCKATDQNEDGEGSLQIPSSPPSKTCALAAEPSEATSPSLDDPPAASQCSSVRSPPIQPDNEAITNVIAKNENNFIVLSTPLDDPFSSAHQDTHGISSSAEDPNYTLPDPTFKVAPYPTSRSHANEPLQTPAKSVASKFRRPRNYRPFPRSRLPRESLHHGPHPRGRKIYTKSKMWMVQNVGDPGTWDIKKQWGTWIRNLWGEDHGVV